LLLGITLATLALRRTAAMRSFLLVGSGLLLHRGLTGRCLAYASLGLTSVGRRDGELGPYGLARPRPVSSRTVVVVESAITVNRPLAELFRAWKEPRKLARILGDVAEIHRAESEELEWTLRQPFFARAHRFKTRWVESNAPTELVWESEPDDAFRMVGAVRFSAAPANLGTQVRLRVEVGMPGEPLLGWLSRPLERFVRMKGAVVLRRFKSLAETGEIPTLQRNPSARHRSGKAE
jgi:uncharacterized membrane protein